MGFPTISGFISEKISPFFSINQEEDSETKKCIKKIGQVPFCVVVILAGVIEGLVRAAIALVVKAITFFIPKECTKINKLDDQIDSLLQSAITSGMELPTKKVLVLAPLFGASAATTEEINIGASAATTEEINKTMDPFIRSARANTEILSYAHINGSSKPSNPISELIEALF